MMKWVTCPMCKSEDIEINAGLDKWYLYCKNCYNRGVMAK